MVSVQFSAAEFDAKQQMKVGGTPRGALGRSCLQARDPSIAGSARVVQAGIITVGRLPQLDQGQARDEGEPARGTVAALPSRDTAVRDRPCSAVTIPAGSKKPLPRVAIRRAWCRVTVEWIARLNAL